MLGDKSSSDVKAKGEARKTFSFKWAYVIFSIFSSYFLHKDS